MRAVRLHSFGAQPVLDTVSVPTPGAGEALVRVLATVVTHLDLTLFDGSFAIRPQLPHTPGVEALGEVISLGDSPQQLPSPAGVPRRVLLDGSVGLDRPGAWAEYVLAPIDGLIPLDAGADELAELARRSPATTARDALFGAGAFRSGERVAITGATGACGMLTTALAEHYRGDGEVIACIRDPAQIDRLPPGVRPLVDVGDHGGPEAPVDLLVDFIGGPQLSQRLAWLRPGGRAVLVGYTAGITAALHLPNLLAAGITMVAFNGMVRPPASLPAGPEPSPPEVPYQRIGLDEIPDACERLRRGETKGRLIATLTTDTQ